MTTFEKNNFCNYAASVALKEIGFDEECVAAYYQNGPLTLFGRTETNTSLTQSLFKGRHKMTAPTFLDARRWFIENHGIIIDIKYSFNIHSDYFYIVISEKGPGIIYITPEGAPYLTEPEAWNAAILKGCEIIKERK